MKIGIVAGVVVENDAISSAVVTQAALFAELPGIDSVSVFSPHIARAVDCASYQVGGSWHLANHPHFRSCDIVVFHWGIHYNEFDALTLLAEGGGPRPIVHFHNCTPRDLVPPHQRETIDRSMAQFHHVMGLGVRLWAVSEYNRQTILAWGGADTAISVVPFPIPFPAERSRIATTDAMIDMICVGRFVPAKGQHLVIDALSQLSEATKRRVRLRLVGSRTFSDPDYVARLGENVREHGLDHQVLFVDDPPDDELWRLFRSSDVVISASAHEGLCVPLIEGYAVGCRAIGTNVGNIPNLLVAGDEIVPSDDATSLAAAITRVAAKGKVTEPSPARLSVANRYSKERVAEVVRKEIDSTNTPTPSRPSADEGARSLRTPS